MATPVTGAIPPTPAASARTSTPDRRLRLDDVLKLMVADGLVAGADADKLARSRTLRFEHPLEAIADQKWKSLRAPHKLMTLEWLVEWLAGKLDVPYFHIETLKIELGAVTDTLRKANAE